MALITCPECKKKISENAESCPKCGYRLSPSEITGIKKKDKRLQKGGTIGCLSVLAVFVILYFIGSFSSSDSPSSKQWFQGGNLHTATITQWMNATYENKLATSADWLAETKWKGHLNSPEDFERIKIKAQMLVQAVDNVAAGVVKGSVKVNEIAVAILTMTNDFGP